MSPACRMPIPALIECSPPSRLIMMRMTLFIIWICQLYKWQDPIIQSHTARLIPIFQAVLEGDPGQVEDERRAELIELVSWLNKMQPGGPASFIEQLEK
ncbi:hypothetical protein CISG_09180 [Coccidioides immitis RMSCC 3703]|uniref:Uncharacterized protein n=1 Tax=Coccidioides immitis RMSCC 3703 TaxID=454286 RepID=A0A0J8RAR6_COCIT|nr:hypothetical protein CISG_09180 [Coccidioides immitis RMSCC 3703]